MSARWKPHTAGIAVVSLAFVFALIPAACRRNQPAQESKEATQTSTDVKVVQAKVALDPRLRQSFQDATVQEPRIPPEGELRPPDQTASGKSVGRMYEEIVGPGGFWDKILFDTADGKRIHYTAVVKTEMGDVAIDLLSDAAPNHVRSFIALAKVGYYDGLHFDRIIRQDVEGDKNSRLEYVEAGCPVGTGEPGYGSIGYWLKPEFSDKLTHEEGTVGACHGEELESAAAKFYITVSKAPEMDGQWTIFGKVTHGLDVVRSIFQRPVQEEDSSRPREPVLIRAVVIQSRVE